MRNCIPNSGKKRQHEENVKLDNIRYQHKCTRITITSIGFKHQLLSELLDQQQGLHKINLEQSTIEQCPNNLEQSTIEQCPNNFEQRTIEQCTTDLEQSTIEQCPNNLEQSTIEQCSNNFEQRTIEQCPNNLEQRTTE